MMSVDKVRSLVNESGFPQRTQDLLVSAYERQDPKYESFFKTMFPDLYLRGGSEESAMTGGAFGQATGKASGPRRASGGALGMQYGEHHDVPVVDPGQKFYTVGRARYKPFASMNQSEDRDWMNLLPLDLRRLSVLLRDIYNQDDTIEDLLQNLNERWAAYVSQNLLAHSGLLGSQYQAAGQSGRFAFDIKLVHQEPARLRGLDINRDMTRIDAIDKLRAIRTVLTKYLPKPFLKVLFTGWIHLDLDENNPNLDPFTDMRLEDFNSDYETFFFPETFVYQNTYLQFMFRAGEAGNYEALEDLQGGYEPKLESAQAYVTASAYGKRYSKFFDVPEVLKFQESHEYHYQNDLGFLFAKRFEHGILISAYGGSVKTLVKLLASETHEHLFVAVPHAGDAYAHGRQECPTELLVDIDLAAEWIKDFRAKATMDLPALTDAQRSRFQNPYADALYEAMRTGSEPIEHAGCSTTGFPHVFYLRLTNV